MYQAYFGLKELPFRISPDPHFIYLTSQHQEVLAKCQYSVAEKMGIAVIFGTIGSGKTSLARRLWEQYATQPEYTFALLIHPNYPHRSSSSKRSYGSMASSSQSGLLKIWLPTLRNF